MRKTDKERREFLRTFKPRMIEILAAQEARTGPVKVTEEEMDACIRSAKKEYREQK